MNEKKHGPRLKARSQLLTRATRTPSVHRVRFTPARILLCLFYPLSIPRNFTLPIHSPLCLRLPPPLPAPPTARRPDPSSPSTHYHFDSPPPRGSLLTLLLLCSNSVSLSSHFLLFPPPPFVYPFVSFVEERKETFVAFPSPSITVTYVSAHSLFSPFLLLLNPFSDFEGSIQCSRYSNSSQRVEYIV